MTKNSDEERDSRKDVADSQQDIDAPVDNGKELKEVIDKKVDDTERLNIFEDAALAYAESRNIDLDLISNSLSTIQQIAGAWIDAIPSDLIFDLAVKATNYDADIKKAETEGEIRGRNAKIEEEILAPMQGDGVPHLQNTMVGRSRSAGSIFDVARNAY